MKVTWDSVRLLVSDQILQGGDWSMPGEGGVDCSEAVRRLLAAAGAPIGGGAAWMLTGWEGGLQAALERVSTVAKADQWLQVAMHCAGIPEDVAPLDVVLSQEPHAPLHVSAVVERRGRKVFTSIRQGGVCCMPGRSLGPILAVYRLPGLAVME